VRNYSWLAWVALAVIIALGWWAYKNSQQPTPPQATAPGKIQRVKIPLEFVGGENLDRSRPEKVTILKGGYANFRANLPAVKNGKYKIFYHGQRTKEGRDYLEINWGKGNSGNPFSIIHRATDFPVELVFFDGGYEVGMPGEAKYFRPGENYIKLWADEELLVKLDQTLYMEITYRE
jgi:hypothetical protein